jgi:hypothetical protein
METEKATGPAWQVRESARQRLLEGIQQKIIRLEDDVERVNLHRMLPHLLVGALTLSRCGTNGDDFSEISWDEKEKVTNFFCEVLGEIRRFQRSGDEGNALLAKLLEWTAGEIARPFHSALQTQAFHEPEKIYGAKRAMDKVPFE